jgi:hypothetical protein
LEYIPLNSLTAPYIQGQLQHMSVERLINFEDSIPKKSNSRWDSLYLFTKFSALTKYIFEKLNFSTNNIFLGITAKVTMACQWVPYYLGYKVLEIPQGMYKVWIIVQKARCWLKDVFSYSLLHLHVNQLITACFTTWVSTMRCIQTPEEELELVGWLLPPGKLDLASRVLIFISVTIRI